MHTSSEARECPTDPGTGRYDELEFAKGCWSSLERKRKQTVPLPQESTCLLERDGWIFAEETGSEEEKEEEEENTCRAPVSEPAVRKQRTGITEELLDVSDRAEGCL